MERVNLLADRRSHRTVVRVRRRELVRLRSGQPPGGNPRITGRGEVRGEDDSPGVASFRARVIFCSPTAALLPAHLGNISIL